MNEEKNDPEGFPVWRVGIHTSIAGSLDQSAERAWHLGCTAFQIFSSSPRTWNTRDPSPEEISALARLRRQYDLFPLAVHASYLLNLASPDATQRTRSVELFRGEISRAAALGAEYLIFHPGSHKNTTSEAGIRTLAGSLRQALRDTPCGRLTILVENTCGQGHTLGGTFAELRDILALLDGLPVGCCIDTAHCFAAGMDLSSEQGLGKMLHSLEENVGLERVPVIHTNDCRSPLGSRLDRHENIGQGGIGLEGFGRIVNHPALRDKAFLLETPLDVPGDDRRNMEAIRSLRRSGKKQGESRRRQRRVTPAVRSTNPDISRSEPPKGAEETSPARKCWGNDKKSRQAPEGATEPPEDTVSRCFLSPLPGLAVWPLFPRAHALG